jgi:hypothetical protein
MMHRMRTTKLRESKLSRVTVLITLLLVTLGSASAKSRKVKSENEAHVVAHISFSGLSAVDMAMHIKASDKYYLYVQHSQDEGVSVIDVSKPGQSKSLGVISWPDRGVSSRMVVTGDTAIISESETVPTSGGRSRDQLVLWDLSNPVSPRVVQKFTGVIKWLQDDRNFIYVLNDEGLWVVSEPAEIQSEETGSSAYGG